MRAVAGKQSDDGEGSARADFVLGDRDGTTCEPGFTEFVRAALAGMGYDVKVNDPYKGVELVRAYSDPKAGRHSLQIEINKRLYMDEATLEKTAGFAALQTQPCSPARRTGSLRCERPSSDRAIAARHRAPTGRATRGVDYVHVLDSGQPGPNVMVQALTHGNEFCGAIALDYLVQREGAAGAGQADACVRQRRRLRALRFRRPGPLALHRRGLQPRLGRRRAASGPRDSAELRRARELRPFVDAADFLLDLHSMHEPCRPIMVCGEEREERGVVASHRRAGATCWSTPATRPGCA